MLNLNAVQTMACPHCGQIINGESTACGFCRTPVDRQTAAVSAALQDRVNGACSSAAFLQTTAFAALGFALLNIIPFLGLIYLVVLLIGIVLLLRWQFGFGFLKSTDRDYLQAKRKKNISLLILCGSFFLFIAVMVVRMMLFGR